MSKILTVEIEETVSYRRYYEVDDDFHWADDEGEAVTAMVIGDEFIEDGFVSCDDRQINVISQLPGELPKPTLAELQAGINGVAEAVKAARRAGASWDQIADAGQYTMRRNPLT